MTTCRNWVPKKYKHNGFKQKHYSGTEIQISPCREVKKGWEKPRRQKLQMLCSSPNMIRASKSWTIGRVEHAASMRIIKPKILKEKLYFVNLGTYAK